MHAAPCVTVSSGARAIQYVHHDDGRAVPAGAAAASQPSAVGQSCVAAGRNAHCRHRIHAQRRASNAAVAHVAWLSVRPGAVVRSCL